MCSSAISTSAENRRASIAGSRKDSIQYRMYERMPARDSSRSRSGPASGTTLARFDSSRSTLLPRRFHAVSAIRRPRATAVGSGSFLTAAQPSP